MAARACDVKLLFCGIVLVFVRPSCKHMVYIAKQVNNKNPPRPVLESLTGPEFAWSDFVPHRCDRAIGD